MVDRRRFLPLDAPHRGLRSRGAAQRMSFQFERIDTTSSTARRRESSIELLPCETPGLRT